MRQSWNNVRDQNGQANEADWKRTRGKRDLRCHDKETTQEEEGTYDVVEYLEEASGRADDKADIRDPMELATE